MNETYDELEALNERKIDEYAPAIAYSALVIMLGVGGNAFSVAYYGFHVPRTPTNVIITALGTADLIACVTFSDAIIELCFTVSFESVDVCKFMYFCKHTLVITSGCILLLVAVDRYRRICRPFAWQLSVKWAKVVVACIVVFSILHSVRDLVLLDVVHVNVTDTFTNKTIGALYCTHTREPHLEVAVTVFLALDFVTFILIIGSCVVLYALISHALWISNKRLTHTGLDTHYPSCIDREETSTNHVNQLCMDVVSGKHTSDTCVSTGTNHVTDTPKDGTSIETTTQDATGKNEQQSMVDGFKLDNNTIDTKAKHINNASNQHATFQAETDHIDSQASGKNTKRKCMKATHAHASVERTVSLMMLAITVASIVSFIPYFVVKLFMKVIIIIIINK